MLPLVQHDPGGGGGGLGGGGGGGGGGEGIRAQLYDKLNPLPVTDSSDLNSTRSDPFTPDKPPSEDGSVIPLTRRSMLVPFKMLTKS